MNPKQKGKDMNRAIIRQGDVLLVPVAAVPHGAKAVPRDKGRVVLAYGEVTGHAHAIAEAWVEQLETETNERWLAVQKTARLQHEEHGTIEIMPGAWKVVRQSEWTDAHEPIRVAD